MNFPMIKNGLDSVAKICGIAVAVGLWVLLPVPAGYAATLTSIAVSPANPTIMVGQSQPFIATGTFSDSTVRILSNATLSSSTGHTCAILSDGTVQCWGSNTNGQLGDGSNTDSATPVTVSGISNAITISAGGLHSCALLSDSTVKCWGNNGHGEIGDGTTISSTTPVLVNGISKATAISAGNGYTCALLSDGTVECWGDNTNGHLGNGSTTSSSIPMAVNGINTAKEISSGSRHACALLMDGTAKCWGENNFGQLGDGSTINSAIPLLVNGLSGATSISTGGTVSTGSGHTCALLLGGAVTCWGSNAYGQLGDGSHIDSAIPVNVSGISVATAISTGGFHTCALLLGGAVTCWGNNGSGQLGDGSLIDSANPTFVSGMNTAAGISGRGDNTCALLFDGTIQCWGSNSSGQLGNGGTTDSATPSTVSGIVNALSVSWSSDNIPVTLVDANGVAAGLSIGSGNVSVTAPGSIFGSATISVTAPPPIVSSLSPATVTYGVTGNREITILGSRFISGATIKVGTLTGKAVVSSMAASEASPFVYNSSGRLSFYWHNISLSPGSYDVTVTNPASGGGLSVTLPGSFTVTAPQPTITSLSLTAAAYGVTASSAVAILGTNFTPGATIKVGTLTGKVEFSTTGATSVSPFVYNTSGRLSFYWSNISLPPGSYDVTVTNPAAGGGLSATLPGSFTVSAPQPTITSLSLTAAAYGVTASGAVAILGTNFAPGATITVGTLTGKVEFSTTGATSVSPFVYNTSGRLSFYWSNTSLPPGSYDVTVTNPAAGGGLSATLPGSFTVSAPQPTITSLSLTAAAYGVTASSAVAILGTNFTPGATIKVGTLTGKVEFSTTGATSVSPFVYNTSGRLSFYWSNTSLPPGSYDVTVTNPAAGGGLSATLPGSFTVSAPQPTITSLSLTAAAYGVTASSAVAILGTNFTPGATITVGTLTGKVEFSTTGATSVSPFVYNTSGRLSFYWSNTSLLPSSYDVTVTNPASGGGLSATLPGSFTVSAPQPTITGISLSTADYGVTPTGAIAILGTSFVPGATIKVGTLTGKVEFSTTGATSGSPFVYNTSGRLSFYWSNTSLPPGSYDVTVTNPASGGGLSAILTGGFSVTAPQPTITGLSLSAADYGVTASSAVAILGTNFAPGATIKVGTLTGKVEFSTTGATSGSPFVYNTSGRLSFYWSNISLPPGSYDVTVTNPAAGGGLSATLPGSFTVNAPQPTITGLSLSTADYGVTASSAVAILGTNFAPGATIKVGTLTGKVEFSTTGATSVSPFVYNTSGRLSFYWSNTSLLPGSYDVTVTNPAAGGGLSATLPGSFTVNAPQPTITSLSLTAAAYGVTASGAVAILGTNFAPGATITVGTLTGKVEFSTTGATSVSPFLYNTSGRLSFYWSNTSLLPGSYDVTVTNPASGGGLSAILTGGFSVTAPQPTITGLSLSTADYGVTPTGAIAILGTNFAPGATIKIGTLTGKTVVSATSANATSPFVYNSSGQLSFYWSNISLPPGSYDVTVTNPAAGGGLFVTLPGSFTVTAPQPTLAGVSPSTAIYGVTGSGAIAISGTNFAPGATITVGTLTGKTVASATSANAISPFVYNSSGQLSFYWSNISLPPGSYDVTVTNPASGGGLSATLPGSFSITTPQPTLAGVSPSVVNFGVTLSGAISILGTNFVPGVTITVGTLTGKTVISATAANAASPFVYTSSGQLSFYWPNTSLPMGPYDVTVTNPVSGGGLSATLPGSFTVTGILTIATPSGGAYNTPQSVNLTCSVNNSGCAATYYTTNGTNPTTLSPIFSTPILITSNTTLKFFSKDNAGHSELVKTEAYIIDTAAPTTSAVPAGGVYGSMQSVKLNCVDSNSGCAATYFTTDGSTPTVTSQLYTGPIPILANTTLKFFSADKAGNVENVRTEVYTLLANATSGPVTILTTNSANLSGVGNANGNSGTAWFDYGTDQTYGSNTPSQIISGNTPLDFHQDVGGLSANTSYHYRFCVVTTGNKVCGADAAFMTRSTILGDLGNISMLIPASANRIDGYDLDELGRAFGSDPSKSNWDALTDLNNDGIVDGKDLAILAINFGKVQ